MPSSPPPAERLRVLLATAWAKYMSLWKAGRGGIAVALLLPCCLCSVCGSIVMVSGDDAPDPTATPRVEATARPARTTGPSPSVTHVVTREPTATDEPPTNVPTAVQPTSAPTAVPVLPTEAPPTPEPTLAPGEHVTIGGSDEANCEELLEIGIPWTEGSVGFFLEILMRDPEDPNVLHHPEELLMEMRRYLRSLKYANGKFCGVVDDPGGWE